MTQDKGVQTQAKKFHRWTLCVMNNTSIWSSTDELCVWWTILVYANMNLPMCNQVAYNWTLLLFFIFPFALNCVSCFPSLSITQTLALFWWARPNWPPGCKLVEPCTRKQQFLVRKKPLDDVRNTSAQAAFKVIACCTELCFVFSLTEHLLKPLLCSGEQDGTKLTSRVQACWTSYEKAAISC